MESDLRRTFEGWTRPCSHCGHGLDVDNPPLRCAICGQPVAITEAKARPARRAPVQGDHRIPRGEPGREPGTIAWAEHLEIFEAYAKRYGRDQSAERIAERAGFGYREIVLFTGRPPTTWEPIAEERRR